MVELRGSELRARRLELQLTQAEFGALVGVSESLVSAQELRPWVSGKLARALAETSWRELEEASAELRRVAPAPPGHAAAPEPAATLSPAAPRRSAEQTSLPDPAQLVADAAGWSPEMQERAVKALERLAGGIWALSNAVKSGSGVTA